MREYASKQLARNFNALDFYDDKLVAMSLRLAEKRGRRTVLELEFVDDGTNKIKTLSFADCANIRVNMDFDVLAHNWFAQADRLSAIADVAKMKKMVTSQTGHWRGRYMPPLSKTAPIDRKLRGIRAYTMFKIAFKGGTIELLAKNYRTQHKR